MPRRSFPRRREPRFQAAALRQPASMIRLRRRLRRAVLRLGWLCPVLGTASALILLSWASYFGVAGGSWAAIAVILAEISTLLLSSSALATALIFFPRQPWFAAIANGGAAAGGVLVTTLILQGAPLAPILLGIPALDWSLMLVMIFRALEYALLGWLVVALASRSPVARPWQLYGFLGLGLGMGAGGLLMLTLIMSGWRPAVGILVGLIGQELLRPAACGVAVGGSAGRS